MNERLGPEEVRVLVSALLLRVSLSAKGEATIDRIEAAAIRELLSQPEEIDAAWVENLPDFGGALASAFEDAPNSEGSDEEEEGPQDVAGEDEQLAQIPIGQVGVGIYGGTEADLDFTAYNETGSTVANLCVDFGTAMTKAFAMKGWDGAIELPIGRVAGGDHPFMVESSVWFEGHEIFFGPDAITRSEAAEDGQRFDSMKSHIMAFAKGIDGGSMVREEINPHAGETDFSAAGLITLYLAYVDRLLVKALDEKGLPGYVKRRIARPCWSGEEGVRASQLLKTLVAKSVVVSHTLGDELLTGLDVETAAMVLDAVDAQFNEDELQELIENTVEVDLAEPEAVAAPFDAPNDWHFMTVVDIGAGTTDVATFVLRFNTKWDRARISLVPNSEQSMEMAGDYIDEILLTDLMSQLQGRVEQQAFDEARFWLGQRIRGLKEVLFREGKLEVELDDVSVELELSDFLELDRVKEFTYAFKKLLINSLEGIPDVYARRMEERGTKFLFSGGGSKLPMIQEFGSEAYRAGRHGVRASIGDVTPGWLIHRSEDFQQVYPQLAVAGGGASPDLPERI